ncbi:regulating synaptic membrane exocytosis protein 2 [Trichonephila clavata]|uniref:Regulating synaptic membrane exocytosis protein 2 n=1 Tax=Trichonephila clavata TaxID=2740835 RepID=A0A8X6LW45_TRICU|nr:regulating synaptic membrane exocytosis protein 2 [Trichonephila clavata]
MNKLQKETLSSVFTFCRWGSRLPPEVGEASSFVEGLGPGQLVGRQALASPYLGEVQLGICEKRNCLEVEVIRARGLLPKANSKVLPTPYIKVYLLDGRRCIAKRKTVLARRTLDPLYQQVLTFTEDFRHCCMQVTVWGNYSSMERKVFMGVVQILLDDIDLVKGVIDWYRLFHHSSLINSLTRNDRSSFLSLDSFG